VFIRANADEFDFTLVEPLTAELLVATPPKADIPAGNWELCVQTEEGEGCTPVTLSPLPVISSISPSVVRAGQSPTLTLNGQDFVSPPTIAVAGQSSSAPENFSSPTQLRFPLLAPLPIGNHPVQVTNPDGGQVSFSSLQVLPNFSVTNSTPVTGPPSGSLLINGTGFTPAITVQFNDTSSPPQGNGVGAVSFISGSQIAVTAPASLQSGRTYTLNLTDVAQGSGTSPQTYEVPTPAVIQKVMADGNNNVLLACSNHLEVTQATVFFSGSTRRRITLCGDFPQVTRYNYQVKFGDVDATIVYSESSGSSSGRLQVEIPDVGGLAPIRVFKSGIPSEPKPFAIRPVITSVSPSSFGSGQAINISGNGLATGVPVDFSRGTHPNYGSVKAAPLPTLNCSSSQSCSVTVPCTDLTTSGPNFALNTVASYSGIGSVSSNLFTGLSGSFELCSGGSVGDG
jgi:hypothetical protein